MLNRSAERSSDAVAELKEEFGATAEVYVCHPGSSATSLISTAYDKAVMSKLWKVSEAATGYTWDD